MESPWRVLLPLLATLALPAAAFEVTESIMEDGHAPNATVPLPPTPPPPPDRPMGPTIMGGLPPPPPHHYTPSPAATSSSQPVTAKPAPSPETERIMIPSFRPSPRLPSLYNLPGSNRPLPHKLRSTQPGEESERVGVTASGGDDSGDGGVDIPGLSPGTAPDIDEDTLRKLVKQHQEGAGQDDEDGPKSLQDYDIVVKTYLKAMKAKGVSKMHGNLGGSQSNGGPAFSEPKHKQFGFEPSAGGGFGASGGGGSRGSDGGYSGFGGGGGRGSYSGYDSYGGKAKPVKFDGSEGIGDYGKGSSYGKHKGSYVHSHGHPYPYHVGQEEPVAFRIPSAVYHETAGYSTKEHSLLGSDGDGYGDDDSGGGGGGGGGGALLGKSRGLAALLKKALSMAAAFLPLGLFLAALPPTVLNINSTAPAPGPSAPGRQRSLDTMAGPTPGGEEVLEDEDALLERWGPRALEDSACEARLLCELARAGSRPGAQPLSAALWALADSGPDKLSEVLQLRDVFKAARTNECKIFRCLDKASEFKDAAAISEETTTTSAPVANKRVKRKRV